MIAPPELDEVARAILAVLEDGAGLEGSVFPPELERPDDPYGVVAGSDLWAPMKLELLARAGRAGAGSEEDRMVLATSLVGEHIEDRASVAQEVLGRLDNSAEGSDPFGREQLGELEEIVSQLHEDIQANIVTLLPECDVEDVSVGGQPALSIRARAQSAHPVGHFDRVINPKRWTECPLQRAFFRAMNPVVPSTYQPATALVAPDRGWTETITEVVDFTLGAFIDPWWMQTNLDFEYVNLSTAPVPIISSTYDLDQSLDGRILVDQGYLYARRLSNHTEVETLKVVRFALVNPPEWAVCPVWSVMSAILTLACVGPEPGVGPASERVAEPASDAAPPVDREPPDRDGGGHVASCNRILVATIDLASVIGAELLDCIGGGRPQPVPTLWQRDIELTAEFRDLAVTPATTGFHRLLDGELVIPPDKVRFVPRHLAPHHPWFTIEVDVSAVPSRPGAYQAIVTDEGTGGEICAPVLLMVPIHPG